MSRVSTPTESERVWNEALGEPDRTLSELRRLLSKAFITSNAGGGNDPFVSIQFKALADSQDLHELLVKLGRQAS